MDPVEIALIGCYIALLVACVGLPYALGMRPRHRDWKYIGATIAFLTWLLAGFVFLRST